MTKGTYLGTCGTAYHLIDVYLYSPKTIILHFEPELENYEGIEPAVEAAVKLYESK